MLQMITVGGKDFENVDVIKERLGISDYSLKKLIAQGMAAPIRIGLQRFYEVGSVDNWLLQHRDKMRSV